MVRIVLAEDHSVMRQRLKRLLARDPEFQLVAETGDGSEAVRLAVELTPDVLVTDLALPGLHGLIVTKCIHRQAPRTRIVIVSIHADEAYVQEAFRQGALGYVCKDELGQNLVPAIRSVMAGELYLSPSLADLSTRLRPAKAHRTR